RTGALLLAAARLSRRSAAAIHQGGCAPRISNRQGMRAQLHGKLRSPDQLHRFLALATNPAAATAFQRSRRTDSDSERLIGGRNIAVSPLPPADGPEARLSTP